MNTRNRTAALLLTVRGAKFTAPSESRDHTTFTRNIEQRGDALTLLKSLPDACTPLVFFDPQHRSVLNKLKFGNEADRQRGRAALPSMTETYIDSVVIESERILKSSGYLFWWLDTFCLVQAHHLRVPVLVAVDLIAWDSLRLGMGKRSRRRGDYLMVLQKPPIKANATWCDHSIPNRWAEKVDRRIHPHVKPIELIKKLIAATTNPGDLIVDPAAGSFVVMRAAHELNRQFIGVDLRLPGEPSKQFAAPSPAARRKTPVFRARSF
jgi:site-specific DNA-methyltransferase (adenine-specific)